MSDFENILTLCNIIEEQNHIIREQASLLAQLGAMCLEDEIAAINAEVDQLLGADEEKTT